MGWRKHKINRIRQVAPMCPCEGTLAQSQCALARAHWRNHLLWITVATILRYASNLTLLSCQRWKFSFTLLRPLAVVYYLLCTVMKLFTHYVCELLWSCYVSLLHIIFASNKSLREDVCSKFVVYITYLGPSVLINTPKLDVGVVSLKVVIRTDKPNHHFQWYKSCIHFWCV